MAQTEYYSQFRPVDKDQIAWHESTRRNNLYGKMTAAHQQLQHNYSRKALKGIFRDVDWFAISAAQTRTFGLEMSGRDQQFLSYCSAANYFRASLPGYWANDVAPVRSILTSAGYTLCEEDVVLNTLRVAYRQPDILLPYDPNSRYERNVREDTRQQYTTDARIFRLLHYLLPVDETRWPIVVMPFYEAAVAEA